MVSVWDDIYEPWWKLCIKFCMIKIYKLLPISDILEELVENQCVQGVVIVESPYQSAKGLVITELAQSQKQPT